MEIVKRENTVVERVLNEISKYQGIVPTGDKQDLKKVRTDLNKLDKILKEDERGKIRPLKVEIDNIKSLYKEAFTEIKNSKTPVEEMIKQLENKEKEEKLYKIKSYINKNFESLEEKIEIKDEYLNLSKSMTAIKESINIQVENYKREQELIKHIPTLQVDIRLTAKENVLELVIETLKANNLLEYTEFDRRFIKE